MIEMRQCKVFRNTWPDGLSKPCVRVLESKAIFHAFSIDNEYYESGPAHYPVAIVELPDGRLASWHVDLVQFDTL